MNVSLDEHKRVQINLDGNVVKTIPSPRPNITMCGVADYKNKIIYMRYDIDRDRLYDFYWLDDVTLDLFKLPDKNNHGQFCSMYPDLGYVIYFILRNLWIVPANGVGKEFVVEAVHLIFISKDYVIVGHNGHQILYSINTSHSVIIHGIITGMSRDGVIAMSEVVAGARHYTYNFYLAEDLLMNKKKIIYSHDGWFVRNDAAISLSISEGSWRVPNKDGSLTKVKDYHFMCPLSDEFFRRMDLMLIEKLTIKDLSSIVTSYLTR